MEKRNTAWYVSRRGELLAEQFILNLHPDSVVASPPESSPFDFIAFFTKPDGTPVTIGVEVKAPVRALNASAQPAGHGSHKH